MFWSILHRTIFLELTKVFLLSLLGITGLILMAGILAEVSRSGLGPIQILQIIPLIIPSLLPYTIPATTLFATSVVYGRLAHDNEILAIRAAGINVLRVVSPAILLGMAMSAVTAALYFDVIATTHHMLRTMFMAEVEEYLYSMLKRDGWIRHPRLSYVIRAQRVQGRQLQDVLFLHRDPKGKGYDIIAEAHVAELHADIKAKKLFVHMRNCKITSRDENGPQTYFRDQTFVEALPEMNSGGAKVSASDMTWEELWDFRATVVKDKEKLETEVAMHRALLLQKKGPDGLEKHILNRTLERKVKEQKIRNIDVEFQMRPALALGCLFFVLVGCPVGIWFGRSDYLSAFITCFLPIVFLYYPLLLCGLNQAKNGHLPLVPAVWGANGLMSLVALVLFRRLLKN